MATRELCPACKRPIGGNKLLISALIGAPSGFIIGASFVWYWFGAEAGFTHSMAIIHEVAGTILGILGGLIIGAIRNK